MSNSWPGAMAVPSIMSAALHMLNTRFALPYVPPAKDVENSDISCVSALAMSVVYSGRMGEDLAVTLPPLLPVIRAEIWDVRSSKSIMRPSLCSV